MELTLFDFEVTDEEKTVEELQMIFQELLDLSIERGNPYILHTERLSRKAKSNMDQFENLGWITDYNFRTLKLNKNHMIFPSVDELIEEYEEGMKALLQREDVCWYKHLMPYSNFFNQIQYENDDKKDEFYQRKSEIFGKYALKLGLNHFYEVTSSRGPKMNPLDSKWQKEHIVPLIAEKVLSCRSVEEISTFFEQHIFFCGRSDWEMKGLPPRPKYKGLMPGVFGLACLSQANNERDVAMILSYSGSWSGGKIDDRGERKIVYPKGWSYEKYLESLTEEDLQALKEDDERLARLHNRTI